MNTWGAARARFCVLSACAIALLALDAQAQTQTPHDLKITVRDVAATGQLVRVPVNKSVLVDFSEPVREVRLANPQFAEVNAITPSQILLTGKSFGTTQMIVWFNESAQHVFDVAVDIELDRLLASIRTAEPRAQVRAHALLDAVVLTGSVADPESAERVVEIAKLFAPQVVNHLKVAGAQQVMLRVLVAEMNRSVVKELGFNGWMAGDTFKDAIALSNLDGINPSNIGVPEAALATADMPFLVGQDGIPVTGSTTMSLAFPRAQLQVFIKALSENGLLRVLAEPNLVALNGREASFLAGGEVPIPIVTDEKIKVEYKEFGVRLVFTPTLMGDGRIRLHIAPELSEVDFANSVTIGGFAVPGFTSRRVETVVDVGAGQTFAIGGLLSERVRGVVRRVPGLGHIPVLGALFSSTSWQRDETELVVLVTPEFVDPIAAEQVTYVPGANSVDPNDFEFYMLGQLEGEPSGPPVLRPRASQAQPRSPSSQYGTARIRGPMGPAGFDEGP